jgi:hypothetical protein
MHPLIKLIIERYSSETPNWFKNIGFIAGAVAIVCGAILGAGLPLPENLIFGLTLNAWLDKIGMSATAVAVMAFSAKKSNSTETQNPPINNENTN